MPRVNDAPVESWGTDHWSTFAFVAHWCSEYGARGFEIATKRLNMRCDPELHPQFAHEGWRPGHQGSPTRLQNGEELTGHDDWSCLEDAEAQRLIVDEGTGLNPILIMTDLGLEISSLLTAHKTRGGNFGDFRPPALDRLGQKATS